MCRYNLSVTETISHLSGPRPTTKLIYKQKSMEIKLFKGRGKGLEMGESYSEENINKKGMI